MLADLADEPMLDRIPFGSPGRVVTESVAQAAPIAGLLLQVAFEELRAGTVGATGVGEDE